ncbi:MAG TPA: M28 family metallopeptidase [Solirubrobacteraceae bacterium]|nr:M28 family metallopeptidase [Solirubrobacteraceae bacterium]
MRTRQAVIFALCVAVSLALRAAPLAAEPPPAGGPAFDAARAFATARLQVALGPRPAGSTAERAAAAILRQMLPDAHFESVPGGLRNIVGRLPGREPAIVVGAHYDTTPVPGYLGANNSAAGVGAVIEIARDLAGDGRRPGDRAVRFVLFDGEEAPAGFTDFATQGLRGSKAYVSAHRHTTSAMILLDFIANRDLRIPREAGSDPRLWSRLRAAAATVGTGGVFPDAVTGEILDDHLPFAEAGIPAIDLIDFDYPCWQKLCDTVGEISEASVEEAGRTVLALVRDERDPAG